MDLYLLNYNNYFNRQVKRLNTLQEYLVYQVGDVLASANFIIGDGINAEHIFNTYQMRIADGVAPNYMIAVDSNNNITRWFVIEIERTRTGQYKYTFRRDIVADNLDAIIDAPCFIEKATVDSTSPFIFNDEKIKVNQILKDERYLTDALGKCAWICAFIPKHDDDAEWEDEVVSVASSTPSYQLTAPTLESLKEIIEGDYLYGYEAKLDVLYYGEGSSGTRITTKRDGDATSQKIKYQDVHTALTIRNFEYSKDGMLDVYDTHLIEDYELKTYDNYASIMEEYNGKVVKVGTLGNEAYYTINIEATQTTTYGEWTDGTSEANNTCLALKAYLDGTKQGSGGFLKVDYTTTKLSVVFTRYQGIGCTFTISKNRDSLVDAPYDMLCFPYPTTDAVKKVSINNTLIDIDSQAMLNIASNLTTTYGEGVVYDIQMLPYCPCQDLINGNVVELNSVQEGARYTTIEDANQNIIGVCLYPLVSSGTFDIPINIGWDGTKLATITERYILKSPNFSSGYELDPFMNNGIDYFNVDFTYLPYQSWIKVNPNFKGLNGIDNNDDRGLILSGNMSITMMTDAWANYQLNNANYEAIFNREIRNMQKNYKYNWIESLSSGIIGGVGQSVGGGIATGNVGVGMALGVANIAGVVGDRALADLKYKEAKSYKKDMYNYNLQNIQALPQGISKTTGLNINFKYYPYIEHYSCTDEEKVAVENVLRYQGMTIMAIGTINDYVIEDETFIQGQMIRLPDLEDDFHMAVEIADEIKRGIYIKRSDI